MRRAFASLTTLVFCTLLLPAVVLGQGNSEVMRPDHFDKSPAPLREMFDRGGKPEPARGGKDFEPGRPYPVGNTNPGGVDPLVERNNASVSSYAQPKAGSVGVGVDPTYRVSPPDTTGDLGPNHYVQWVNLRYAVYDVVRDGAGQISAFNLRAGFPKNGSFSDCMRVRSSSTGMAPRSVPSRRRGATVPSSASFLPTTRR